MFCFDLNGGSLLRLLLLGFSPSKGGLRCFYCPRCNTGEQRLFFVPMPILGSLSFSHPPPPQCLFLLCALVSFFSCERRQNVSVCVWLVILIFGPLSYPSFLFSPTSNLASSLLIALLDFSFTRTGGFFVMKTLIGRFDRVDYWMRPGQ